MSPFFRHKPAQSPVLGKGLEQSWYKTREPIGEQTSITAILTNVLPGAYQSVLFVEL